MRMNVNLTKFVSILNREQSSMLQAATVIMLSVFGSRILGLLKYRLLAAHFGQSIDVLDSYIAASQIPEAIFEIIIFGAVSIAFIPIFSRYINLKNYSEGWKLASSMISLGLVSYLILAIIFFIFADFLALIFAPGITADNPVLRSQVANLMRVMLFAQIFFVFSTFLTGVLQTFQRFLIPAIAAMVYNVGIILGIIFLSPYVGIYAPAWGMVLGAFLHLLIQIPISRQLGVKFSFKLLPIHPGALEIIRLSLPRTIALAAIKINDLVNNVIITGFINYSELAKYINLADVCINPFDINKITNIIFPSKIYQYLACEKPVIATRLAGLVDLFPENGGSNNIFYFDLNKPKEFFILTDRIKYKRIKDQNPSLQKIASILERKLEKLTAKTFSL